MNDSKKLTKRETEEVADLIKIRIKDSELEKYSEQLSTVLDYLDVFEEVDTKDTEITSHVTGLTNVFREDKVEQSLSQQEATKNANKSRNGYIIVKRVI
jgi:aspartyl-tRNA(Asn)/glutamyl-tRNA(Gln) amidotransferase subunit C